MTTLLVVGASGGTGRQLVVQALARGWAVRAWSRTEGELPLRHAALEHVSGDVTDPAHARRFVAGLDAVVCALGSVEGLRPTHVCAEGTRVLVAAMRDARVARLVAVTSLGTTHKMGPVHAHLVEPYLLRGIYGDKREQERRIAASGLEWVIVRPGRLVDRPDRGAARVVLDGPLPGVHVSRAALARFALDQVRSDRFVGLAPYLVEPARVPWHKVLTLGRDAHLPRAATVR